MYYLDIVDQFKKIESVNVKGTTVIVNGNSFSYKHPQVAKAVAEKISYFLGV